MAITIRKRRYRQHQRDSARLQALRGDSMQRVAVGFARICVLDP